MLVYKAIGQDAIHQFLHKLRILNFIIPSVFCRFLLQLHVFAEFSMGTDYSFTLFVSHNLIIKNARLNTVKGHSITTFCTVTATSRHHFEIDTSTEKLKIQAELFKETQMGRGKREFHPPPPSPPPSLYLQVSLLTSRSH